MSLLDKMFMFASAAFYTFVIAVSGYYSVMGFLDGDILLGGAMLFCVGVFVTRLAEVLQGKQ